MIEEQTIRSRAKIERSTNYESYLPSYVQSQTIYNYQEEKHYTGSHKKLDTQSTKGDWDVQLLTVDENINGKDNRRIDNSQPSQK